MFQHTAARRRLQINALLFIGDYRFNTQPHGGGCPPPLVLIGWKKWVSTHSRTEAAAEDEDHATYEEWFQHTAARRRLPSCLLLPLSFASFQHTAARRRLRLPLLLVA